MRTGRVELMLIDDGKEFNPLMVDPHHNEAETIEELEIGGKGWTLVRAYMNEFEYDYSERQEPPKTGEASFLTTMEP